MNPTLYKSLQIIAASLGLALIFNYLFFSNQIGISVLVIAVVLLGTIFLIGKHQKINLQKSLWLFVPILFFSLMPSVRASEFLTFFKCRGNTRSIYAPGLSAGGDSGVADAFS